MILVHQGLPGSGKSYEAVVKQIFVALKADRPVDAYVEGLDTEKIAAVLEMPRERVEQLLQTMTREQAKEWHKHARPNALVVIDEAQELWPTQRLPLPELMMRAIAEHRHHGQDVLLMTQVFTDMHKFWRGRVSQRNTYIKLDAVGREGNYSYSVEKATSPEKFNVISKGFGTYDAKYFGTYKSHVDDTISTENFKDPRANVKNAAWVKYGMPVTGLLLVWGLWTAWGFFHQKPVENAPAGAASAPKVAPAPVASASAPIAPSARKRQNTDFVSYLNDTYRPRLSLLWKRQGAYVGSVEWWDGDKVRERLTFVELAIMGAEVDVRGSLVKVNGTWVTPWQPDRAQQLPQVGAQVIPLSSLPNGT